MGLSTGLFACHLMSSAVAQPTPLATCATGALLHRSGARRLRRASAKLHRARPHLLSSSACRAWLLSSASRSPSAVASAAASRCCSDSSSRWERASCGVSGGVWFGCNPQMQGWDHTQCTGVRLHSGCKATQSRPAACPPPTCAAPARICARASSAFRSAACSAAEPAAAARPRASASSCAASSSAWSAPSWRARAADSAWPRERGRGRGGVGACTCLAGNAEAKSEACLHAPRQSGLH